MQAIVARAYAKINLFLNVSGKRTDGYHELDGVMIPVSLYDTLRIAKARALRVTCDRAGLDGRGNIAHRAAALFFQAAGIRAGADIFLRKRIPLQAGLGGGSSDAACALACLNRLYGNALGEDALFSLAAQAGADVPFFLADGAQRARGKGERLTPVRYALKASYVLVKPSGGVDTALAYRLLHELAPQPAQTDACLSALAQNDLALFSASARNMLEPAAFALCPQARAASRALLAHDAATALVTGSGSAVYGLFESARAAQAAAAAIAATGAFAFAIAADYTKKPRDILLEIL